MILVENTYEGELIVKNRRYLTTKKDKGEHGLGLENVKNALKKYNGCINLSHTEQVFSVIVLIPC